MGLTKKQSSHFHVKHRVQQPKGGIPSRLSLLVWKIDCILKESGFIYNRKVRLGTDKQLSKNDVLFFSHIKGHVLNKKIDQK